MYEDVLDDILVFIVIVDSLYVLFVIMLLLDKLNGVIMCYELY